jgi:hypothetical protein
MVSCAWQLPAPCPRLPGLKMPNAAFNVLVLLWATALAGQFSSRFYAVSALRQLDTLPARLSAEVSWLSGV